MDHDHRLALMQTLWHELAPFLTTLGAALQDGRVSPGEGLQLSMGALAFAGKLVAILQTLTPEDLPAVHALVARVRLRLEGDDAQEGA